MSITQEEATAALEAYSKRKGIHNIAYSGRFSWAVDFFVQSANKLKVNKNSENFNVLVREVWSMVMTP